MSCSRELAVGLRLIFIGLDDEIDRDLRRLPLRSRFLDRGPSLSLLSYPYPLPCIPSHLPMHLFLSIQRPKRALRRGANKLEHWTDKAKGDGHSIADSAVEAEARLAEIEGSVHGTDRATITSQDAELEGRKENSVRSLVLLSLAVRIVS